MSDSSMTQPHDQVIDERVLDDYANDGTMAFATLLIQQYQLEADTDINALSAAIAVDSEAAIVATAHHLRGAAATIGAASLSALCGELEATARRRGLSDARWLGDAIAAEHLRVLTALDRWCLTHGARAADHRWTRE